MFAAGAGWSPQVRLAFDQHQWRADLVDISDRRTLFVVGFLFPRSAAEPGGLELGEVGGVPEVAPVGDGSLRHGSFENISMANDPVRQQTAAAAAGDAHPIRIHPSAGDQVVYSGHQILVVVARIVELDD